MFDRFKSKQQALLIGVLVGALSVLIIAAICGLIYTKTTSYVNDNQRYRAVCEAEGGVAVGTEYCIVGNDVVTIHGIN